MKTSITNKKNSGNHKKRPIQYYASTLLLVLLMVGLEIGILTLHILWVSRTISIANLLLRLLSFFVMLHIINQDDSNAYKLAWCIPILLIPLVGGLAYLIAKGRGYHKKAKQRYCELNTLLDHYMIQNQDVSCPDVSNKRICQYLKNNGFVSHNNDHVTYYAMGKEMFDDLLNDLKNAKRFIFLEYFIVQEGLMWNSILEILKEKAAMGVDVRVMYDGMGCIRTLPRHYPKTLVKWGIKTKVFSPFVPVLSTLQNNRDHRKITVIDGNIAYTGGINLADEYINEIRRYGVWKDSAVRMEGGSANSFTKLFLCQWYLTEKNITDDIASYFVNNPAPVGTECIVPYAVSPLEKQSCGKDVYQEILGGARSYVYIMTPYLIPGEELMNAMMLAAKSGIDVRILTPHISDKPLIHIVTRSKYEPLLASGVRIFEYAPGFIHSKNMVSDDSITVCGSVNMDYRSLFLHFECASMIYGTATAECAKEDFLKTCEVSTEITSEMAKKRSLFAKIYLAFIRTLEPLL